MARNTVAGEPGDTGPLAGGIVAEVTERAENQNTADDELQSAALVQAPLPELVVVVVPVKPIMEVPLLGDREAVVFASDLTPNDPRDGTLIEVEIYPTERAKPATTSVIAPYLIPVHNTPYIPGQQSLLYSQQNPFARAIADAEKRWQNIPTDTFSFVVKGDSRGISLASLESTIQAIDRANELQRLQERSRQRGIEFINENTRLATERLKEIKDRLSKIPEEIEEFERIANSIAYQGSESSASDLWYRRIGSLEHKLKTLNAEQGLIEEQLELNERVLSGGGRWAQHWSGPIEGLRDPALDALLAAYNVVEKPIVITVSAAEIVGGGIMVVSSGGTAIPGYLLIANGTDNIVTIIRQEYDPEARSFKYNVLHVVLPEGAATVGEVLLDVGAGLGTGVAGYRTLTRTGAVANDSSALTRMRRLIWDNRNFQREISSEYWASRGPANGRSLHHWLIPQRAQWVPQGIRNSGLNLIELPPFTGTFHRSLDLNRWMGFARNWGPGHPHRFRASVVENSIRAGIPTLGAGTGYVAYQIGDKLVIIFSDVED